MFFQEEAPEIGMPRSQTSPDFGRKHHTLPNNYKHPPEIKVQRKSSSSSGELPKTKKRVAERRRRAGQDG